MQSGFVVVVVVIVIVAAAAVVATNGFLLFAFRNCFLIIPLHSSFSTMGCFYRDQESRQ